MFILLFYFLLLNMKLTSSTIIIQGAGVYDIKSDDIAMIFYLTVENSYDHAIRASVYGVRCLEGDPSYYESADHMFLLGGDMGFLEKKSIRNLTLIYPNLYLRSRVGSCLVSLHFVTEKSVEEMRKEIYFDTSQLLQVEDPNALGVANMEECPATDCVIKYSSRRSYFNKEIKRCQPVPDCPPNTVYIPKSNTCRKLHVPVCKTDLEMIEDGDIEKCHTVSNLVHFYCHHGSNVNVSGQCICDQGWTTSTCSEGAYHPTLNLYHMCNIEVNSWQKANKEKILMTILVLIILALLIVAKMLIAVCILNWCCQFIKSKSRNNFNEEYCGSYGCPYSYCGDEECICDDDEDNEDKSSRIIKVSFTKADEASSGGETDVTVSFGGSSRSVCTCRCKHSK